MQLRGRAWIVAAAIAVLGVLAPPAAAQTRGASPPPPGANDACRADQRPTPVVLVHGTFSNRGQFFKFSPQLEGAGHCVFALTYGCTEQNSFSCGRGPIERSARQLRNFINDRVLPQSRSGKVSIVGHSQGGLMPRYYIKFLGGRDKVRDMVSFAASNHGTDNPLAPFSRDCAACFQQSPYMSAFTRQVNQGDETAGPIHYTQIQTRFDDVVFPYFSAFLTDDRDNNYNGPQTRRMNGPRTANVCLQDRFVANTDDHLTIGTTSDQALLVAEEALRRDGPARVVRPDSVCAKLGGDPGGGGSNGGNGGSRPPCTITGTSGNDVLVGTPRDDVICAGAGNDIVRAAGGDDQVYGGPDNDTLRGDAGNDRLFGEGGPDAVNSSDGVRGNDSVNGGGGNDACNGDSGDGRSNCP